jgi:hypothetical protein
MSKKTKNNKKDDDEEYEYELEDEDDVISDIIDDDIDEDEINEGDNEQDNDTCCIMEDVNDDEIYYNIDIPTTTDIKYLAGPERISLNRLTKYEMVRILGERTKQSTFVAKYSKQTSQHGFTF